MTFLILGLVASVVPGGPGPQNAGLERPDAQRRGRTIPEAHLPATTKRAIVALFPSRSGKPSWPSSPCWPGGAPA